MQVIHLSAECYPVAKVGGLGDVVAALPKYQCLQGIDAKVVMPYYNKPFVRNHEFENVHEAQVYMGDQPLQVTIFKEKHNVLGFDLYLVHIPGLLDRDEIYSYPDENEQFIAFQTAVLHWINVWETKPNILHCHDHHTGLVPFLVQNSYDFPHLRTIKTVTTVHNAQYQGWIDWSKARLLPHYDDYKWGLLDWGGTINSLATSIKCCDFYTTVSPGYLNEIYHEANGLQSLFSQEWAKGQGIVNGIDIEVWDTSKDPMLYDHYTADYLEVGKKRNKQKLCEAFGLDVNKPLLAFIGRLVGEKGADLLFDIFETALLQSNGGYNAIILGSGSAELEDGLRHLHEKYPNHVASYIGYNDELSHKIYAAADFLIMPSRVEPCGLNQLYAMRYGTIPIVHRIGGLGDTVKDYGESGGYGICFGEASVLSAVHAIIRAITLYKNQKAVFNYLRKMIVNLDFSWENSSKQYVKIYQQLKL